MSLTSQLDDTGSPFAKFMSASFPDVKNALAAFQALRPADNGALCPQTTDCVPWSTLGTAIDRRLRYAFCEAAVCAQRGIAAASWLAPPGCADVVKRTGDDLTEALASLVRQEQPAERTQGFTLATEAEEALDRMCYSMAWFDDANRTQRLRPGTPLADAGPDLDVSRLLEAVPEFAVQDIASVVRLAGTGLGGVRDDCPAERAHVCPKLAGAAHVGGADADLIADDLLLEFSSTATPSRLGRRAFYQILGYVMLDYGDRYGVRRLGVYLTRFGQLVTWGLDDYLALLGTRRSLDELREECAWWLAIA